MSEMSAMTNVNFSPIGNSLEEPILYPRNNNVSAYVEKIANTYFDIVNFVYLIL